jgi:hypothetical protein
VVPTAVLAAKSSTAVGAESRRSGIIPAPAALRAPGVWLNVQFLVTGVTGTFVAVFTWRTPFTVH